VSIDEQQHVALPKLYGAPAYSRPRAPILPGPRPFDPDQLPLEVFQTDEEVRLAEYVRARTYESGRGAAGQGELQAGGGPGDLRPRAFSLRAIAGRLFGS
jgi:hypothetical protein